ncbi:MAG: hypothetical protein ACLTZG_24955 [Hungatella hathewayi]|uniref:hypothetical protein n=1 Tax=Hungatella hathewayi TaxID=154046 RepID=UPI00399648B1
MIAHADEAPVFVKQNGKDIIKFIRIEGADEEDHKRRRIIYFFVLTLFLLISAVFGLETQSRYVQRSGRQMLEAFWNYTGKISFWL